MNLWGGRFTGKTDEFFAYYNASFRFDRRLLQADLQACGVQAQALGRAGVLQPAEVEAITGGLKQIAERFANPASLNDPQFAGAEDVHSFIESRLVELIGPAGFKLHTGRSRNDQVAVATRLFLRGEMDGLLELLRDAQRALVELAERYPNDPLPGYTHLQKAQPVLFAHFLLAYFQMLTRDGERLLDARKRVNVLPLGSGALAGTNFPVEREWMAEQLGFDGVTRNSLDAVSDRDFAIEFAAAASLVMVHVSRMSEELILWMSQNYAFIRIADRFTTGSSIMPQKKNPDVPELARGKTGRVVGHLMGLITLMKGQPLAYNKDNQEDKEPLFDTVDTLRDTLRIFVEMIGGQRNAQTGAKEGGITVNAAAMQAAAQKGYATATDLADYLVKKGLPFRDAHETVAHAVKAAQSHGCDLSELPLATLQGFHPAIEKDVFDVLSLRGSLNARGTLGGTAPAQVRHQIARHRTRLVGEPRP